MLVLGMLGRVSYASLLNQAASQAWKLAFRPILVEAVHDGRSLCAVNSAAYSISEKQSQVDTASMGGYLSDALSETQAYAPPPRTCHIGYCT